MVSYQGSCEGCYRFTTIVIDPKKNYNTSYHEKTFLCQECEQKQVIEKQKQVIEKRDKKLNQLLKRNWFDNIFKR